MGLVYDNNGQLQDIPCLVPSPNLQASRWYSATLFSGSGAEVTGNLYNSGTTGYCYPFVIRQKCTISQLGIFTAATGSTFKVAIYGSNAAGELTGNPLTSVTFANTTAGNLSVTLSSNIQLTPGIYWFVILQVTSVSNILYGTLNVVDTVLAVLFGSTSLAQVQNALAYNITCPSGNFPNNGVSAQGGSAFAPIFSYYVYSVP